MTHRIPTLLLVCATLSTLTGRSAMGQEATAPRAPGRPVTVLAGSTRRLVAIRSMDDAQGTATPPADQVYRVTFGADGRAAFTLKPIARSA